MDIYKVFLLVLAFALNMTKIYSQQSMDQYKEEFYKLKYCSTVVYMVPRA